MGSAFAKPRAWLLLGAGFVALGSIPFFLSFPGPVLSLLTIFWPIAVVVTAALPAGLACLAVALHLRLRLLRLPDGPAAARPLAALAALPLLLAAQFLAFRYLTGPLFWRRATTEAGDVLHVATPAWHGLEVAFDLAELATWLTFVGLLVQAHRRAQ